MRNPLWRLKTLPWIPLLQNALLTVLLATVLDIALLFLLEALRDVWPEGSRQVLGGGTVSLLLLLLTAGGIGALGVILLERIFRQVLIDAATLWALVGCLALVLFVKRFFPVPTLFVGFSQPQLIGLIFGLFAQGRGHWR